MKKILLSAQIVIMVLLFAACSGRGKASLMQEGGDTVRYEFARNLQTIKYKNYTIVNIRNPWDTIKTLHTYILLDRKVKHTDHLPEGSIVRTPMKRGIVYSSVHCGLMKEIGSFDNIAGVCDLEYNNIPGIKEGCNEGTITDCGNSMNPDIESIIDISPDGILLSPFENSGGYGKIETLGIPIIECADYMEGSPLARAEWMKFYGLLMGKEEFACVLFESIKKEYTRLSKMAKLQDKKPTVVTELKNGAAWYVPTGMSTTGQLIADAGGKYIFGHLKGYGAIPLSVETVVDKGHDADIWLIKYGSEREKTYADIAKDNTIYTTFKAYKEKRIYGCNTFAVPFYEESPFHPDILLKDLISIFHPKLTDGYKQNYFTRIEK